MPTQKTQKVGFAVFFILATLGAVLLIISQIPLTREYYDVVDTRSFSVGEPLTFYWTFEVNVGYRFEVKRVNWAASSRYLDLTHYFSAEQGSVLFSEGGKGLVEPPWVWDWSEDWAAGTMTMNVTFWHYGISGVGGYRNQEIDWSTTPALVEISELKQDTYHLTYLVYLGLPLLIISAIVITRIGKDVDSRMRMPNASAR